MKKFIKAFIPKYISNRIVVFIYNILKISTNHINKKVIEENARYNKSELLTGKYMSLDRTEFIENQKEWKKIKFGQGKRTNMEYSGCGIIAVYNALVALRMSPDIDTMVGLISRFELDGAVMNGRFGISPMAIKKFFVKEGYDVDMVTTKSKEKIDSIGEENKVFIATIYNDKTDISEMLHTVCITKDSKNKYIVHNCSYWNENRYMAKSKNYTKLSNAIADIKRASSAVAVIGIKCKKM